MDSNGSKSTKLRNKLISLLYLCFISMIAISVSKEVLSGFGQIWNKTEQANLKIFQSNEYFYTKIEKNIEERPEFWADKEEDVKTLKQSSAQFHEYMSWLKLQATESVIETDPDLSDFEKMDKGDDLDNLLFVQDQGAILEGKINNYVKVVSKLMPNLKEDIELRFNIDPVVNNDGTEIRWLNYNYEGFPLVSSLAKFSQIQNDIRVTESDILSRMIESELENEASTQTDNYNEQVNINKKLNASVVADKMNVVYRSVDNPMTITIPGVSPDRVKASAPGLKKIKGSKYILKPHKGRIVDIMVSGTLADGTVINGKYPFRIKSVPAPVGSLWGATGNMSKPKSSFSKGTMEVKFPGFDFETDAVVTSFRVLIPGAPSIKVTGNKMDDKVIKTLSRARSGTKVLITDIKAKSPSTKYIYKDASPIVITII